MAVEDFLRTYQESMLNRQTVNPLNQRKSKSATNPSLGISTSNRQVHITPQYGQSVPDWLTSRTSGALDRYMTQKGERTSELASQYMDKAAGQVSTNEYGIPTDKLSDFSTYLNKQISTVGDYGKAALATEEAKARWQTLQNQAELNAGFSINYTPGASGDNPGSKAVSLAMQAQGTPYVWGGNSLTKGVDCSGLVQQVYKQLGINLPRTTYEQAKYGKVVSTGALLPGDLVFYNTGGGDPNGIGNLSHVGIYIGNGQIIHAPGRGKSVKVTTLTNPGQPARAVRPW